MLELTLMLCSIETSIIVNIKFLGETLMKQIQWIKERMQRI